jgi:hypothetical protein
MTLRKATLEAKEMKEAKKEAGLCLHEGCGSEAIMPQCTIHHGLPSRAR